MRAGVNVNNLNVISLNVCGVMSRLQYPDFIDFLMTYDIICLTETKTNHLDSPKLPGYVFEMKNRKNVRKKKSGGIILGFKEELKEYIDIIQTNSDYVLWFKVNKCLMGTNDDVIFGIVYIPPQNSVYCIDNPFHEIELELLSFSQFENKCLLGDFNARVSTEKDYFEFDDRNNLNLNIENYVHKLHDHSLPLDRCSKDKTKTHFGNLLLDFCKSNNLFICNGRFGESSSLLTCKDASVVDYVIVSGNFIQHVHNFSVLDFCNMLSDAHCPLCVTFNCKTIYQHDDNDDTHINESEKIKKWDVEKSRIFVDKIDSSRISDLITTLENVNPNNCDINLINESVENLCKIITDAAADTFGTFDPKRKKKIDSRHKPWFNRSCKEARKKYRKSIRNYKQNKSIITKSEMNKNAKEYKRIMNKYINEHKNIMKEKIDNLKSNNPREFWKIINDNKKSVNNNIDINTLFEFFKDLNEADYGEGDFPQVDVNDNVQVNNIINSEITEDEIKKAINNLRNNKTGSDDKVINEYIKYSLDKTLNSLC